MQSSQTGEALKRIIRNFNLERAARRNVARYLDICACRLAVGFQRRGKRDNEARNRLCERQRPDGAISALSVAVIVIVCFAFVSAVKVFPETESVCVAPSVIAFFVAIVFPSIFSTTFTVSPVRIGYAVLIGEIGALDPKIGITAGNHGRLVMDYGNISACGVCGIIAVAVLRADAVFQRVPRAVDYRFRERPACGRLNLCPRAAVV
ncbi:MAG: hypothetical protein ACLR1P_07740 [Oscillospiraceae bacterium]